MILQQTKLIFEKKAKAGTYRRNDKRLLKKKTFDTHQQTDVYIETNGYFSS